MQFIFRLVWNLNKPVTLVTECFHQLVYFTGCKYYRPSTIQTPIRMEVWFKNQDWIMTAYRAPLRDIHFVRDELLANLIWI